MLPASPVSRPIRGKGAANAAPGFFHTPVTPQASRNPIEGTLKRSGVDEGREGGRLLTTTTADCPAIHAVIVQELSGTCSMSHAARAQASGVAIRTHQ